MTDILSPDGDAALRIEHAGWPACGDWFTYPFPHAYPNAKVGETNIFENSEVVVNLINGHSYLYRFRHVESLDDASDPHLFQGATILFCSSGPNPGHFLSEVISFTEFFVKQELSFRVAVPSTLTVAAPFIFSILKRLNPGIRILLIEDNISYRFHRLIVRRNQWFNYLKTWESIGFQEYPGKLLFGDLRSTIADYINDPTSVHLLSRRMYEDNKHRIPQHDKYFVVKSAMERSALTPSRGLYISNEARSIAEMHGYQFLLISDFKNIDEYLATLYSARLLIFSYGAIMCTNRFFVNPDASVLLLANTAYKAEYSTGNNFWHIRHSHLCPVKRQHVILDFPDTVEADLMLELLSYAADLDQQM